MATALCAAPCSTAVRGELAGQVGSAVTRPREWDEVVGAPQHRELHIAGREPGHPGHAELPRLPWQECDEHVVDLGSGVEPVGEQREVDDMLITLLPGESREFRVSG